MNSFVLDASAVLALLQNETGEARVRQALREGVCFISTVNLAEVATRLYLRGLSEENVRALCAIPNLEVVPFSEGEAYDVAALAIPGRPFGLSLGDRACLACGTAKGAIVLTTDRVWKEMPSTTQIETLR